MSDEENNSMIGGEDVILPCDPVIEPYLALAFAIGIVKAAWPDFCEEIDTKDPNELFLYKNNEARDSWDRLGADPSNANTMIYLLAAPGELTVVVTDPDTPEMKDIIAGIAAVVKTYNKS